MLSAKCLALSAALCAVGLSAFAEPDAVQLWEGGPYFAPPAPARSVGFGGNVGLVGNITDWIGIYGQVGYEWVDKSDVSTGGFKADIDYSSLVLSAGVQVRF